MAVSDRNARRSDEAERSRQIAASESVAFATMLLGLLNDADTVLHRMEHEPESRDATPAAPPSHPTETTPVGLAPADSGQGHEDQHAGTFESPAAELSPTIHDATTTIQPQDASAVLVDDAPSGEAIAAHASASSPALSDFSASVDPAPSADGGTAHGGSIASSSLDLGASIHNLADTVTGIVDTTLATVTSAIASLSATVGQLTSILSDTVSHLADGLTGAVTGLIHDAPATGLLEPLVTEVLGSTPTTGTDFSDATSHGVSLLDTAGAIPTTLLHHLPLQLGFLGQPTIDGHEPHDGAFSALGVHHF